MNRAVAARDVRTHWLVVAAIALLLLNDHVLKAAWPGIVTGKLSDVAGLAFFPILLTQWAKTVRGWAIAGAITAVAFAAIKVWPEATELYRIVVGSLRSLPNAVLHGTPFGKTAAVTDPTDLAALPSVFVTTWVAWRKSLRGGGPAALQGSAGVATLP